MDRRAGQWRVNISHAAKDVKASFMLRRNLSEPVSNHCSGSPCKRTPSPGSRRSSAVATHGRGRLRSSHTYACGCFSAAFLRRALRARPLKKPSVLPIFACCALSLDQLSIEYRGKNRRAVPALRRGIAGRALPIRRRGIAGRALLIRRRGIAGRALPAGSCASMHDVSKRQRCAGGKEAFIALNTVELPTRIHKDSSRLPLARSAIKDISLAPD